MTADAPLKTGHFANFQEYERDLRAALEELESGKSAQSKTGLAIALAIRAGLAEVACEIRSASFAGRQNGGRA